MPRRIPAIALIIALSFQAFFVVPAAIAGCCCETHAAAATASEDCAGHHADKSDHGCPCCNGGMALACGSACAAVALPIFATALTASFLHDSVAPTPTAVPSSQDYSPLKPPPIA